MALKESITVGEVLVLTVDADPSVSGVAAPLSSLALLDDKASSSMWLKTGPNSTDWSLLRYAVQINTTDATVTTLASFTIPTDQTLMVEATVIGRRTGGSAGTAGDSATYIRKARIKNVGGAVTLIGLTTEYTSEDQVAWNATIDVSGTTGRVRITGAANNNITWSGALKIEGG